MYFEDGNIYIKIRDTGKGIPNEIAGKIFDPFFTTKPKFKDAKGEEPNGTGLGLDSVLSLLKPYGAKITFESEPGKGTEFTICLPVKENQTEFNK